MLIPFPRERILDLPAWLLRLDQFWREQEHKYAVTPSGSQE